ncbi:hypothetical protein B1987_16870 [Mycobacterium kansasii]|nr:hypothetical protein B1987_16870 [Mycobacterium kansasii]
MHDRAATLARKASDIGGLVGHLAPIYFLQYMLCKQYAMACMFGRPGAGLAGALLACGIAPSAGDPTTGYKIALTRSSGGVA